MRRRLLLYLQFDSDDYREHIKPMFYFEPCVYGHRILSNAASIFAAVRQMPAPPSYVTDAVAGGTLSWTRCYLPYWYLVPQLTELRQ